MSPDNSGDFFTWLSAICAIISSLISILNNYTGVLTFFKELDKTKVRKYCKLSIIIFSTLFVVSFFINILIENIKNIENARKNPETTSSSTENVTQPTTTAQPPYQIGDIVSFGSYEQDNNVDNGPEPIDWLILDHQNDSFLLLSCDVLDSQPYSEQLRDTVWKISDIRSWLHKFFYRTAFSYKEQNMIQAVEPPSYGNYLQDDDYVDQVFLLDKNEVSHYLPTVLTRMCSPSPWAAKACNVQTDTDLNSSPWMLREERGTGDAGLAPAWHVFYNKQDGRQVVYFMFSGFLPQNYTDFQCLSYVDTEGTFCTAESAVNAKRIGIRPAIWVRWE